MDTITLTTIRMIILTTIMTLVTIIIIEIPMGLFAIILRQWVVRIGTRLAGALFVACRTVAIRRWRPTHVTIGRRRLREGVSPHVTPSALADVHSQLYDLANEMETDLPRQFQLIDRLIDESDREIARLQRRLGRYVAPAMPMRHREPDILPIDDFEADHRRAAVARVQLADRPARRAA